MGATRARFGSLVEWVLAAVAIVAVLAIGSVVVREFRTVSAVLPVSAREALPPDPPATLPSRVVSVPILLLSDGAELRVGDGAEAVESNLARRPEIGPRSAERTPAGERVTRFYEDGGRRFIVVFEPLSGGGEARVAAIYLQ
jgi:hypothetical protein